MHELRFVGLSEDGEGLVLTDDAKSRYILTLTDDVRAAIRRDRRPVNAGASVKQTSQPLRPRDVQGLIRAGVPLEEIAERAGWSLEKVQRYEGPIRAERDYVSELAQAVILPSRNEATTLRERADRRLADRGVEAERIVWDSWKADETYWTVVVRFPAGGRLREATWQFDPINRTLRTVDDEARWLGGDGLPSVEAEEAPAPQTSSRAHRDVAVYDVEAEGGLREAKAARTAANARAAATRSQRGNDVVDSHAVDGTAGSAPTPGSKSATDTAAQQPDVTRVVPLNVKDAAEPPLPSHPRPQDIASAESADNESKSDVGESDAPQAVDANVGTDTDTDESQAQARQVARGMKKSRGRSGRATKRSSRHVPEAPVRSALLAGDEEDDEELFDELPGYHDGVGLRTVERDEDWDENDLDDEPTDSDADEIAQDGADAQADVRDSDAEEQEKADTPAAAPAKKATPKDVPSRPNAGRRSGRPSVPSWDDIMFGGGRGSKK